jgi:UDP-glucose 4-epimerase
MTMKPTALVLGVSGFLGCHNTDEFISQGYLVTGLDSHPSKSQPLDGLARYTQTPIASQGFHSLLQELQPSFIINCAGSASVAASLTDPAADFKANTVLVFEIPEAIRRHAPESHFILLSSAAIYGNPSHLPISEGDSSKPLSPYGFHKQKAESLCHEYSQIYGFKTTIARIFSAYDPGLERQVIWDILRRYLQHEGFELMGTGKETREFLHATTDVAKAIRTLAEKGAHEAHAYNVVSGVEVSRCRYKN